MVDFSYETINQIKEATDDGHVEIIIEDSIKKFSVKKRSGFTSKRRFMMNMVMTLRYVKAEGLNAKASQNVSHAIEVFELFRKQESSDFFWAEIDLRGLQGSKFLIYFLQHFSTLIPSRKREEIFRPFIVSPRYVRSRKILSFSLAVL